ncbi:unnamed protein product, partial [Eruca vesicaria subsp. sativa]|nr:unnamed protein product [Eruca vesicaria subsp. sativa]
MYCINTFTTYSENVIMDKLNLLITLFETGYETAGRKHIELIKTILDEDHLEMLNASQFGKLLKMGVDIFY